MAQEFYKDTDGKSFNATLSYSISGQKPVLLNGIPGFPYESGDSGDMRAVSADGAVYRMDVGASLDPSIGDVIYVTLASVSGTHEIPAAALTVTADGANTVPFLRVLATKDASNFIEGKLINFNS